MIRPPFPTLLHLTVAEAAMAAPERTAFRCNGQALSFGELAGRSARLARTFAEAGVRRGDRVALYLDRSLEAAVALYAVFRAGAAYVPIDPAAPAERVRAILEQCAPRCLVTDAAHQAALPGQLPASLTTVICTGVPVDGPDGATLGWDAALAVPEAPTKLPDASEQDLAYVIFTSGSTGAPKGIMHTHASGLSYATMAANLYGLHSGDRISNACGLHFDMSTFDYFCGPLVGAATTIIPDPWLKMPASLAELIEDEGLTVWYSVPFALIQLLMHGDLDNRDLGALRLVLYGGEQFIPKHLEALRQRLPGAVISNVYGPAETNQCTVWNLPADWTGDRGPVPIGAACPNAELLVLDDDGAEVAPGEAGELAVRSPTMMRGYWRRPDLNARAFVTREGPGGDERRYYLTGDIVRQGLEGLAFAGRRDRQVKSRGFRVELDEVEDALAALPAVAEAAAFLVEVHEGLSVIGAAAVLHHGTTATEAELSAGLAARLPAYARPESMRIMEVFPRTTSGKVDRKGLAEAARGRPQHANRT